jgi:hypothetical protein
VEKQNEILLFSWLTTGTDHKNLTNWGPKKRKKKNFKVWRIWVIFSTKNPLYRLKSYFSGPVQKTL